MQDTDIFSLLSGEYRAKVEELAHALRLEGKYDSVINLAVSFMHRKLILDAQVKTEYPDGVTPLIV